MKRFFKLLISKSNEVSSRRIIALMMLLPFWGGATGGVWIGLKNQNFEFFATSIGLAALTIYLAFYALTWEHAKDISNSRLFKKSDNSYNELIDP